MPIAWKSKTRFATLAFTLPKTPWTRCDTSSADFPMTEAMSAQFFTVTLRAEPGSDGVRGQRALLKRALRSHGLRALDVREGKAHARRLPPRPGASSIRR
jgi:hypothetical protein